MKSFLMSTAVAALALVAVWVLTPAPEQKQAQMHGLPWQIKTFDDGTSEVLDIHIGKSTLNELIEKFSSPENIGLFVDKQNRITLEAYYGRFRSGPLSAKLVVTLDAAPDELQQLASKAINRNLGPSGDQRLVLADEDKAAQADRVVKALTYLPSYSKLDAEFFRTRFGEPTAYERIDETSVRWFYPKWGLSILIDAEAGEALQYAMPKDYDGPISMPEQKPTKTQ